MTTENSPLNRRTFLRGAFAAAVGIPLTVTLASCVSGGGTGGGSGGTKTAKNPFGVAADSSTEAVIFNGGYGYDYVQFAAEQMQKQTKGLKVKVSPSTQIAQQLQPRFVGGNPPDLIDNSGAGRSGSRRSSTASPSSTTSSRRTTTRARRSPTRCTRT